jgi:hypothetical protein
MFKYEVLKRLDALEAKFGQLLALVSSMLKLEKIMSQELDNLATQVKANTDAEQSAVTLLGNLSDLIKQAGTDPAKLQQLTTDLDASKQKLAEAIVANTPASGGGGGTSPPASQSRHKP